jgi:hypothetical protein
MSHLSTSAAAAAYISQLNQLEQKVLQIAASHLESSFSLVKSIGFQEWQAEQENKHHVVPTPAPAPTPPSTERKIKIKIHKKKLTPTPI